MILTQNQVDELLAEIDKSKVLFVGNTLGADVLSAKDLKVLKTHGIDPTSFPKKGSLDLMFKFGLLADAIGNYGSKIINLQAFRKFIGRGGFVPLSTAESFAIEFTKQRSYNDISRLSSKIQSDISNAVLSVSNRKLAEATIRKETITAIKTRKNSRELSSEISKKLGDWATDFDRISDYVMHEAFDKGKAHSIERKGGKFAKVYKEVYAGACKHCQRLYTVAGYGSEPKIFTLAELQANGDNIGRKVLQWKPVIGSTHPWCRCELYDVPLNQEWSRQLRKFVPIKNTSNRKNKVKVTITP